MLGLQMWFDMKDVRNNLAHEQIQQQGPSQQKIHLIMGIDVAVSYGSVRVCVSAIMHKSLLDVEYDM